MGKNTIGNVQLPTIDQVGIVVKDVNKTVQHYQSKFGVGPFVIQDVDIQGATFRGKPAATTKIRVALAQVGNIQIEFIEVLEGGELYKEFLKKNGEGLHHLGTYVEDANTFEKMLTDFANEGIKPLFSRVGNRFGFAYLDTTAVGGVILELINMARRKKT